MLEICPGAFLRHINKLEPTIREGKPEGYIIPLPLRPLIPYNPITKSVNEVAVTAHVLCEELPG
jgi:hypothetical protein